MSFDVKCYELAKAFLSDEPELDNERHAALLAQDIQDTIETYMQYAKQDIVP